mmetsp:Transcript_15977/g.34739  ORF Transcript_15977/g.34739 Transcript_15977/m.34739 type:complete len:213 (+) Transcript_15977:285-923(+)|eukprot:CAMPEP_0178517152 /NCGR_PEP_ID=MMETSP0696-20121128/25532_1 /TAXON_ID=265572 /ORGANISM="Extubocellulus spinifer, Strain CCMP396" /LENGTH=212 /DNA_ID=CAMNT_0020147551 /DNA_START=261 /DNA_END=899 /DNA_ORIENTATION=-
MSSTRAASAASSRRAKQKLVQLLFGPQGSGKGREAHKRLDHASYSFADLKTAFLQRVHDIHPDKRAHKQKGAEADCGAGHEEFVRLQEAWADYEKMAKMMTRVGSGSSDANFILFGVGCSFSDSPDEQRKRSEIMDQAGRGWLTAGVLSERTTTSEGDYAGITSGATYTSTRLVDDEMFVEESDEKSTADARARPKKALVDIPKHLERRSEP